MNDKQHDSETDRALRLFVTLARCFTSVTEHTREDILRHGLKPSEFAVLELLYHKGPTPLGEIAGRVLLTTGSITHLIDQLEKKGLAKRAACPNDRRVLYADLTDAGREKIAAIFPGHAETIRLAVSGLSADEQEQAAELLKKMGMAAQSLPAETPPPPCPIANALPIPASGGGE